MAVSVAAAGSAFAGGGLTLSPLVTEHQASPGYLGSVTVRNTSASSVSVSLLPRPWVQQRSGRVTANRNRTLLSLVRPSTKRFKLAAGQARTVRLRLLKSPAGGSLYGAVTVRATPVRSKKGSSGSGVVVANYELVGSLRATPTSARHQVTAGDLRVSGRRARLAVRNGGNTIDPISGSYRLAGPQGTVNGDIKGTRILPGNIVDLPIGGKLPAGTYRLTGQLSQSGERVASINRSVKVR
jgi:hypothetical protein